MLLASKDKITGTNQSTTCGYFMCKIQFQWASQVFDNSPIGIRKLFT